MIRFSRAMFGLNNREPAGRPAPRYTIRHTLMILSVMAAVGTTAVDVLSYLDWPGTWQAENRDTRVRIAHYATRMWRVERSTQMDDWLEIDCGWMYTPVRMPLWVLVAMFAAYPIVVVTRLALQRSHRRKQGLCLYCGYNLLGNTSGVCPECGSRTDLAVPSAAIGEDSVDCRTP